MRPRKFYLGFPPAIVKTKRNGIEYGIGAIPLGGYVKIPGMHRPAAGDLDHHFGARARRTAVASPPGRCAPRARLEESDYAAGGGRRHVPRRGARGGQVSRRGAHRRRSAASTDVDDAPGAGRLLAREDLEARRVIFAGPGANLLFAIAIFAVLFMARRPAGDATVGVCSRETPAAIADRDGQQDPSRSPAEEGPPAARPHRRDQHLGSRTADSVRSGSRRPAGSRSARSHAARDAGISASGSSAGEGLERPAAIKASANRSTDTWHVTKEISSRSAVWSQARGASRSRARRHRPGLVPGSASRARARYLRLLGLISLSLALLNLLPLLPLDGGHIAFSLVEGIRGKAVHAGGLRARLGGRDRAGTAPLLHRPLERHRPPGQLALSRVQRRLWHVSETSLTPEGPLRFAARWLPTSRSA